MGKASLMKSTEAPVPKMGKCPTCDFRKGMMNPAPGTKLPKEYGGKCTRPGGLCGALLINMVKTGVPQVEIMRAFGHRNAADLKAAYAAAITEDAGAEENPSTAEIISLCADPSAPAVDLPPDMLSDDEQDRREFLEFQITDAIKTAFYDVGKALKEINESRLYRSTHDTFDAYCKDLWEMARQTAYQYIAASDVVENVRHGGQYVTLPKNERQARALVSLPPEKQIEAWGVALETAPNGKVTAAHVKKTVKKLHGEQVRKTIQKTRNRTPAAERIDPDFRKAYDAFMVEIQQAIDTNWKHTSKEAVCRHLDAVRMIIAPDTFDHERLPMPGADSAKVMAAGFTLYRADESMMALKRMDGKGSWRKASDTFPSKAAMYRELKKVLQNSKAIMG